MVTVILLSAAFLVLVGVVYAVIMNGHRRGGEGEVKLRQTVPSNNPRGSVRTSGSGND